MITLTYADWAAQICPEYGMNTISLAYRDEQILRASASAARLQEDACIYGTPMLLPPNRTDGGRFTFEGVAYALPINDVAGGNHLHGFLNRTAFVVDAAGESCVTAHYENRGELFPFCFRVDVVLRLEETGYHQMFSIMNTGDKNMPLTFGIHTNFAEKPFFAVPLGQKWEKTARHIPTGKLLPLDEREQVFCTGFVPDSSPISGFYTSAGHTARIGELYYHVSENFDQWILWNGNGQQGFVSIEPQCGAVNALNSGTGLKILAPGQAEVFSTCISTKAQI